MHLPMVHFVGPMVASTLGLIVFLLKTILKRYRRSFLKIALVLWILLNADADLLPAAHVLLLARGRCKVLILSCCSTSAVYD